jgi:hypothetical protein
MYFLGGKLLYNTWANNNNVGEALTDKISHEI